MITSGLGIPAGHPEGRCQHGVEEPEPGPGHGLVLCRGHVCQQVLVPHDGCICVAMLCEQELVLGGVRRACSHVLCLHYILLVWAGVGWRLVQCSICVRCSLSYKGVRQMSSNLHVVPQTWSSSPLWLRLDRGEANRGGAAKLHRGTMASTETLSFDHVYMHGRTVKVPSTACEWGC